MLHTVLQRFIPCKSHIPFTFLPHSVCSNRDSTCMLLTPYPPTSRPLHVPKTTKCHKSHPAKACKPHAHVLATCEAHAQNERTSDMPAHPVCSAQSTRMSQSKLFQTKMHNLYLQLCSSRLDRNLASLCFWRKASPSSAPMLASSCSRVGSDPRHASASKEVRDTPQTLAPLLHFSPSMMLSAEQGWLLDLQAKSFGYA